MDNSPTDPIANRKSQSRGEARRRAMIEAAWQVLQEKGCEAATLSDIIALSGGSRATLYEAFGGKEGLMEAAVAERCSAFGQSMQLVLDERNDPRMVLETLAFAFLSKVVAPESTRTLGIFVAEGGRFPQMIETFLRHGPRALTARVAGYLASATRRPASGRGARTRCRPLSVDAAGPVAAACHVPGRGAAHARCLTQAGQACSFDLSRWHQEREAA